MIKTVEKKGRLKNSRVLTGGEKVKYIFNARQKETEGQPIGRDIRTAENMPAGHLIVRMGRDGRNAVVADREPVQPGDALLSIPDYEQG